ncbi:hypothetical protein J3Q64DRAFT_1701807 [Phycomyces blakesleeanus]|uniref:Uncharacterized protein n=2 Tax=Phycomyces blakesleeanus TaxID=4837 RepID=A0A162TIP2_PHYB8|nr:hypothetical protein PHYBLDRAFT_172747 [Phycomyces blakesleeanus NRRL 1555(-)]OAD68902.1 hypothetical protein PHYBLDRAFT_172747 [Phycomyces blakesleeanus NRRL 1555(-)]|eukprot:XP_018286942.1 hypothetical protein PHYBLDRAFT_172747 [Phycomyces blakesleeanus NRRL 1555(-)]
MCAFFLNTVPFRGEAGVLTPVTINLDRLWFDSSGDQDIKMVKRSNSLNIPSTAMESISYLKYFDILIIFGQLLPLVTIVGYSLTRLDSTRLDLTRLGLSQLDKWFRKYKIVPKSRRILKRAFPLAH